MNSNSADEIKNKSFKKIKHDDNVSNKKHTNSKSEISLEETNDITDKHHNNPLRTQDIIKFPYKITNIISKPIFTKFKGEIHLQFNKRFYLFKQSVTKIKNYYLITLKNGKYEIQSVNNLYYYCTPVNFIAKINNTEFYENFSEKLLHQLPDDNNSKTLSYYDTLHDNSSFSEYIPNKLTLDSYYKDYDYKEFKHTKKSEKSYFYKYDDEIPKKPKKSKTTYLKDKFGEDYEYIYNKLSNLYKSEKIIPYTEVKKKIKNDDICSKYSNDSIKKFIPEIAYYLISGPFRMSWVLLGYDPKSDQNNFKHQLIGMRNLKCLIRLTEHPNILNEIERDRAKYLHDNCEYESGFLTPEALEMISQYIRKEEVNKLLVGTDIDKHDNLEFDLDIQK